MTGPWLGGVQRVSVGPSRDYPFSWGLCTLAADLGRGQGRRGGARQVPPGSERNSRGAQNSWGHFKVGRAVAQVL